MLNRRLPLLAEVSFLVCIAHAGFAQTISLSSAKASGTGSATLNLTFASAGNAIAALQWTIQYPAGQISSISATAGPVLTGAGKSITCQLGTGSYTCIAYGMNATNIGDGLAATISVTAAQTTALTIVNSLAASAAGSGITLSATGGTVTATSSLVSTLNSLACTPASITAGSSTACTVSLTNAATGPTVVSLSSNNAAVTVPQSVTVASGATTTQFSAAVSGSASGSATLTAGLNGISQTATLTVAAATPSLSSLACNPTSLSGPSSTTCTVTLSGTAAAATTVNLSSNNTAVVVPQSVTVLAGSATVQFSAVASSSLNATVTLTATLNGTSKITTVALTTSTFSLRVHPGPAYVDAQGFTWSADTGYTGGQLFSTTNTVAKTNAVPLYQSVRYGSFRYEFTVPNGSYTVNLKFAEVSRDSIGQRVFSVLLNGNLILYNFDIIAAAGGPLVAIDKSFPVSVTNGSIKIGFVSQVDLPMVNAIEIVQQGAPLAQTNLTTPSTFAPLYINAGGRTYTAPDGLVWAADENYTGGSVWSTRSAISNTATPALYQTCRYGTFFYPILLPNGSYTVTLKFAELGRTAAGQRIFDVEINGAPVLTKFDIVATAGGPFVALDKTFSVTVSNGVLVLGFTQGSADLPLVNAIEVVKAN